MYYLFLDSNNSIGFKIEGIHEIVSTDIPISNEIYNKYFELQSQGKQYRIKNINGTTFDEIFEEYISEVIPQPKSEVELLKEQINTMQGALDFIIINY